MSPSPGSNTRSHSASGLSGIPSTQLRLGFEVRSLLFGGLLAALEATRRNSEKWM
jgi:hypothetical protein